ncbi:MAG: SBBP repeat-containing protein [Pyrinomonadaceae bacterium]
MQKSVSSNVSFFGASLILASLMFSSIVTFQPTVQAEALINETIQIETNENSEQTKETVKTSYENLPLSFEINQGQTDERVKFLARSSRFSLFLTEREAVLRLRKKKGGKIYQNAFAMQFEGANSAARIEGVEEQARKSNYFIGDESNWRRNVTNYGKAVYRDIYDGIDAVFYGSRKEFEYDFVVAPNADANQILLNFRGAKKVLVDDGCMIVEVKDETIKFAAPVTYQETGSGRQMVASRYVLKGKNKVAFEVGEYDKSKALIIDPKLIYSTYVGGNVEFIDIVEGTGDSINGLAVDAGGSVYIAGNTDSSDFPVSSGAFQNEMELRGDDACLIGGPLPCGDAFVMKLKPDGSDFVYSTYLGGHNSDAAFAIAVDSAGKAYVTGGTDPFNAGNFCINPYLFPTTLNPYQNKPCYGARRDSDAFFTVLTTGGDDLVYSTYFGGSDEDQGNAIAIDSAGNAYIAGESNSDNLPDKNAFQTKHGNNNTDVNDAFIAKFNPNETGNDSLLYASLLGGNGEDKAHSIAVDAAGNAYVAGETASNNLTVKAPSGSPLDSNFNGGASDGFIAKIDPTNAVGATSLVSLTYYGGAGRDVINGVTVEPATQRAHITGRTDNATGFPILNAFDTNVVGNGEAFVAKLNADVTAQFYSSFLGGSSFDEGRAITLDAANNVYLTGNTISTNFPHINAFQNANAGGGDAFLTKISAVSTPSKPKILYSSFLGGAGSGNISGREDSNGIALDKKGNVYIGGITASPTFPTTAGVFKPQSSGVTQFNTDGFVAKIETTFNDTIGVHRPGTNQFLESNSNVTGTIDKTVGFGQAGDIGVVGDWEGDGIDDVGVFRIAGFGQGQFIIRKITPVRPCPACPLVLLPVNFTVNFGQTGDLPIIGDWDGDGIDTFGVFRQNGGQAQIFLTDEIENAPPVDHTLGFGTDGDLPIAGDWDADNLDEIGVSRPGTGQFFLTNDVAVGNVDFTGFFGAIGDLPAAGDFDGDGKDTIAVYRPTTAQFFLSNDNINIAQTTVFGQTGDKPVVGDWDGKPNQ